MMHMEYPASPAKQLADVVNSAIETAGVDVREVAVRTQIPETTLRQRLAGVGSFSVADLLALAPVIGVKASALMRRAEGIT